jgi:protein-S-isoprenylcysteine O-methyltransferase Ste14
MIYALPIPALWAAWLIYWSVAAIGAKAAKRRESAASRAAHLIPLALAVLLIFRSPRNLPSWAEFLSERFLASTDAGYGIGVVLVALGLGFSVWARRLLGGNWSGTVTVKENHELIRTGPYRVVRHPIYTGLLLAFTGSAIAIGEWRGVVAVLLVVFAFYRKIRLEERWMTDTFGERYGAYRAETKALIPFLL